MCGEFFTGLHERNFVYGTNLWLSRCQFSEELVQDLAHLISPSLTPSLPLQSSSTTVRPPGEAATTKQTQRKSSSASKSSATSLHHSEGDKSSRKHRQASSSTGAHKSSSSRSAGTYYDHRPCTRSTWVELIVV